MKKIVLLSAVLSFFTAASVNAQEISYDYFDAAYQWIDNDKSQEGPSNGLTTAVSMKIAENFVLEGGYDYAAYETSRYSAVEVDARRSIFSYGALGYYPLCDYFHLTGRVGGLEAVFNYDEEKGDEDQAGVYVAGGMRYAFENKVEVDANVTYYNISSYVADWVVDAAALYPVAEKIDFKAGLALTSAGGVALESGLRYKF